ncbi:MAG: hypothetical protein L0215_03600 [Gemmataceae bacterium]|nr:hypothetical protein [Gemmataceae bacterium]
MEIEPSQPLSEDLAVHRIGGKSLANLQLKEKEKKLDPPGISIHLGGTPEETVAHYLDAYPDPVRYSNILKLAKRVATATVKVIRAAGFDVLPVRTTKFPNHGRIIHPQGVPGFEDPELQKLARMFEELEL